MVPVREVAPEILLNENFTSCVPTPTAPVVTSIHNAVVSAVQMQSAAAATAIVPVPPAAGSDTESVLNATGHGDEKSTMNAGVPQPTPPSSTGPYGRTATEFTLLPLFGNKDEKSRSPLNSNRAKDIVGSSRSTSANPFVVVGNAWLPPPAATILRCK